MEMTDGVEWSTYYIIISCIHSVGGADLTYSLTKQSSRRAVGRTTERRRSCPFARFSGDSRGSDPPHLPPLRCVEQQLPTPWAMGV